MITLADILLIISGLLVLSMVADSVCRRLPIPYTVLLVILGLVVNYLSNDVSIFDLHHFSQFHLTSELVLYIFLPALVFESALSLDARALLKNIVPILMLAIVGMLVSVALVGFGVWWSLDLPIIVALLFASLISATDPVAVIALFKELGVSRRLSVLVEGESLMNDATAIVLFNIVLMLLTQESFTYLHGVHAVVEFFKVFLGGIAVGIVSGLFFSELLVRLYHGNQSVPVVLSLVLAYFTFIIAEHEIHVSGVMAVLSAAITLNISAISRLSKQAIDSIHITWEFLVLICNSLLFVMIGLTVDLVQLAMHWQAIMWTVLAVYLARAVSVYLLIPVTTRSFSLAKISMPEQHILWWGGLKGGLAIAIVMSIPDTLPERPLLESLTLGVVLVSLLVNAPSIRWLMHYLKMDSLSSDEQAELKQNMHNVKQSVNAVLHRFATLHLLDSTMESSVESKLHSTLDSELIELTDEQLLRQAHLQAVQAEVEEIEYLYEIGVVNYYTLVTYKDILRIDRQHSIDYLSSMGTGWRQPNKLLDMERFIIHTLSEVSWAQGLLTQYQTHRFANKILHDIAGVLMAHRGLKVIQQMIDNGLDEQLIKPIQHIYKKRLRRRQNRLQYFSKQYPVFYQRYEAFVFQKVALRYSLKLVRKRHEQGMISAKVLQLISKKLTRSLEQLTSFKMTLPIVNRHAWLNRVPLFENLPKEILKKMGEDAAYVNFLPGDTIFYQGEPGDSLYVILSGQVKIMIADASGNNKLVAERGEGKLLGVRALRRGTKRSASIVAKTYVTCLRLTSEDILRFAAQDKELVERLQKMRLLGNNG